MNELIEGPDEVGQAACDALDHARQISEGPMGSQLQWGPPTPIKPAPPEQKPFPINALCLTSCGRRLWRSTIWPWPPIPTTVAWCLPSLATVNQHHFDVQVLSVGNTRPLSLYFSCPVGIWLAQIYSRAIFLRGAH